MKPYLPCAQKLNYTCGPTAIANALALYGLPTSQEATQGAAGCGIDGTNTKMLSQAIRKFGFYPIVKGILKTAKNKREKENALLEWIKAENEKGRFVIIGVNGHGKQGHWVLCMRVQSRGITIWDSACALPFVTTKKNLFRAWVNPTPPIPGHLDELDAHWFTHVISLSPRSKLARRAVEIRKNLINPPIGLLPTLK